MRKHSGAHQRMLREFSVLPSSRVGSNYMKYTRHLLMEARDGGLTPVQVWGLMFIYDLEFFTADYFIDNYAFCAKAKVFTNYLTPYKEMGYIDAYFGKNSIDSGTKQLLKLDGGVGYKQRYALTQKGRLYVEKLYRKLEGREAIYLDAEP